jgi:tetratricopeptide (TPR) repeat protein
LRGIQNNNSGVKRYNGEKMTEAYDEFARGLADLPFQPEVHYNLGRTLFENKEYKRSYQESMTAAKLAEKDPEIHFHSLFQAASAKAADKKVDEALALYQQALELKPDSKETKTNIELLLAGGAGSGDGGEPSQDKQGQGEGEEQPQNPRQVENPRSTPRPFKSQDLSKKDVENILDELKSQEENIRAKFQREGAKDAPNDKDW